MLLKTAACDDKLKDLTNLDFNPKLLYSSSILIGTTNIQYKLILQI